MQVLVNADMLVEFWQEPHADLGWVHRALAIDGQTSAKWHCSGLDGLRSPADLLRAKVFAYSRLAGHSDVLLPAVQQLRVSFAAVAQFERQLKVAGRSSIAASKHEFSVACCRTAALHPTGGLMLQGLC